MLQKIIASHELPSVALEPYINKYWKSYNPTQEIIDVPIVPDGCIDILLKNSELIFSGLMRQTEVISIYPEDSYFGIQFKPYAIAILLDRDVSVFNDLFSPLHKINSTLANDLDALFKSETEPTVKLNEYFENIFLTKEVEPLLLESIDLIRQSNGNITVSDLTKSLKVHPKKLERLFKMYIGVSTKKFSQIVRFHNTHRLFTEEGMENLLLKVLDKGYFDQAHFNRDFKKFTGVSPHSKLMSILYNT